MKDCGVILSDPLDGGGQIQQDLLKCCHCGYRWVRQPGSGRSRGFCTRCMGVTCERPECVARNARLHLPEEGWLEVAEGRDASRVLVAVR